MTDQNCAVLEVAGMAGGYADTTVLRDIGFTVRRGEVLGIVGRNGVGKSTLLKCLIGVAHVSVGNIRFEDESILGLPTNRRRALGISYAPQEGLVFGGLTVRSNLVLHRSQRDLEDYAELLDCFPCVRERLAQRAGVLSGAEKRLLSFCRTMAEQSALTLMDEPTDGVQQESIDHMVDLMQQRTGQGASFIVVEQNLDFLLRVASHILVMDQGEVVLRTPAIDHLRESIAAMLKL